MSKQKTTGNTHYVVYWCEHLRDGIEEYARVWPSMEAALDCIARLANGFAADNLEIRLFELGREIPLERKEEKEPQPDKVVRRYFVPKKGGA
jgi:hypothetical protein